MIFGKQVTSTDGLRLIFWLEWYDFFTQGYTCSSSRPRPHSIRPRRRRSRLLGRRVPVVQLSFTYQNLFWQLLEVQAQHAFIRDEHSKGRWDAALTRSLFSFMMEVFDRTVGRDLGPRMGDGHQVEHVC